MVHSTIYINSLPNDKVVDWSNLKAFADNKFYITEKLNCFGKDRKHKGK